MPAAPNNEHPVDLMYRSTRPAWERYRSLSTPWPEDWPTRCRRIAHRMVITRTRITLLEFQPVQDVRVRTTLRDLRAELNSDQRTLDEHGYVPA